MKKITTSFVITMGAALLSSISATTVNAETNPFGVTELSSGYMQLAEAEMACGANMKMETPKTAEGACAAKKSEPATKGNDSKNDATKTKDGAEKSPEPKK
ncbi:MAG: hypothetical protein PHN45_10140 [Methylococcales bacterium]|nr:hypothetical protein [Methylococcales bacterium]MDD5755098.1 hypothetical protein [Methylococcales bacterium]